MKDKNIKKYFVITSFIILSIIFILPCVNAEVNESNYLNLPINKISTFKINFKGEISLVNIVNKLEESNKINNKLSELCKNDKELQKFIKTYNFLPWVEVESKGYGLHCSFHRIFLSTRSVLWRSIIKYNFYNDSDYTKGRFIGDDKWINITGKQQIRLVGFRGYVSFKPSIILGRLKVHDIVIHGYTLRIDKMK